MIEAKTTIYYYVEQRHNDGPRFLSFAWSEDWKGQYVELPTWKEKATLKIFDEFGIAIQSTGVEAFEEYLRKHGGLEKFKMEYPYIK